MDDSQDSSQTSDSIQDKLDSIVPKPPTLDAVKAASLDNAVAPMISKPVGWDLGAGAAGAVAGPTIARGLQALTGNTNPDVIVSELDRQRKYLDAQSQLQSFPQNSPSLGRMEPSFELPAPQSTPSTTPIAFEGTGAQNYAAATSGLTGSDLNGINNYTKTDPAGAWRVAAEKAKQNAKLAGMGEPVNLMHQTQSGVVLPAPTPQDLLAAAKEQVRQEQAAKAAEEAAAVLKQAGANGVNPAIRAVAPSAKSTQLANAIDPTLWEKVKNNLKYGVTANRLSGMDMGYQAGEAAQSAIKHDWPNALLSGLGAGAAGLSMVQPELGLPAAALIGGGQYLYNHPNAIHDLQQKVQDYFAKP